MGNLTGLLAKIMPAVAAIPNTGQDRSSKNYAFVETVAEINVKQNVQLIRERSPILKELEDNGEIKIVGATSASWSTFASRSALLARCRTGGCSASLPSIATARSLRSSATTSSSSSRRRRARALLDRVKEAPPYPGAKPYYLIDAQLDDAVRPLHSYVPPRTRCRCRS